MQKIICFFVGIMLVGGAYAADVAERQSCADIKARIDGLEGTAELNDFDAALLTDLRAKYRSSCMARAAGRGARTIAAAKRTAVKLNDDATEKTEVVEETVVAEPCTNPDSNGCCPGEFFADYGVEGKFCCNDDFCFPPMDVKPTVPEKTEKEIADEIAANIEKGLCGDGTKPNKFGCCTGEMFKDLGNNEFGCCKKDTNECFPPMK